MTTRLYIVTHRATGARHLVEATNPAQALRHVATETYGVAPAKPMDVAELLRAGSTLVRATPEQITIAGEAS